MPTRHNIEPALQVGDKIVQIGPLDWSAFRHVVEVFAKADLPLPKLDSDALKQKLGNMQASASLDGSINVADVIGLVIEFVSENLPTIAAWFAKHPPLLEALVTGATNLTPEETAALTTGQVLRVARAAFRELVNDGVFAEAAGFFGELLGLRPATLPVVVTPNPAPAGPTELNMPPADATSPSAAA